MAQGNTDLAKRLDSAGTAMSPAIALKTGLTEWYNKNESQVTNMLGGDKKKADQLFAGFWHSVSRSPNLLQCSKGSLIDSMLSCAALEMYPGVMGECAIVEYKGVAQMQPMYRGLIKHASSSIHSIQANVVYEKDLFEFEEGTNTFLKYKKSFDADRGRRVAVYCIIKLATGGDIIVVLSPSDIEKVKNASRSAKSPYSPWQTWEDEMWKKTAIKRALKLVPLRSHKLAEAIAIDDEHESPEKNNKPILSGIIDGTLEDIEIVSEVSKQEG